MLFVDANGGKPDTMRQYGRPVLVSVVCIKTIEMGANECAICLVCRILVSFTPTGGQEESTSKKRSNWRATQSSDEDCSGESFDGAIDGANLTMAGASVATKEPNGRFGRKS